MKNHIIAIAILLQLAVGMAGQNEPSKAQENVRTLFPLDEIRVTDAQFLHIQELNHQYLLTLEPDRLLSNFRREAGLTPKARPYPGWEDGRGGLLGHMMGFYLSSMSMMYQTTKDEAIADRLRYAVAGLAECQKTHGDGFLSATLMGRHLFERVSTHDFTTDDAHINGVWEPTYVINKLMLGLYDAYAWAHINQAKDVLIGVADWFGQSVMDQLDHEEMQKLLFCEHGSLNESYVDVYRLTGDHRYLAWAQRLNDEKMLLPLQENRDILNGWHANTQIPKFTGFNSIYRYTGDENLYNAARNFWNIVTGKHTWVNGGNSTGEHFFAEDQFKTRVTNDVGPESCNSVNMMRLTESLYETDGRMDRIDYYERVLYSHIIANYDPVEGMCVYYTQVRPGHYKRYPTKYESFWCCVGTGIEAPGKFGKMIYAHDSETLYVNMYLASELNWQERGFRLTMESGFPDEDHARMVVSTKGVRQAIALRVPKWVTPGSFTVKVNGHRQRTAVVDGYVRLNRTWKNGDRIDVDFKPELRLESVRGTDRYDAFVYGPVVLGASLPNVNLTDEDGPDWRMPHGQQAHERIPMSEAPILYGSTEDILRHTKREKGSELKFVYQADGEQPVTLIPYNRIHFTRYAMYFLHANDKADYYQTMADGSKYEDHDAELNGAATDYVIIGDGASEQAHAMQEVDSYCMRVTLNKMFRQARGGGYFMYELKGEPGKACTLYLGHRVMDNEGYAFDVKANGRIVKSYDSAGSTPVTSYKADRIAIPAELMTDGRVTIKVEARCMQQSTEIFDLKLLKEF